MEHSAQQWASELTRVGEHLSHVTHRMQVSFGNASERSIAKGNGPIPDPVKLLRRMAALETRLEQLRAECLEVSARRETIVPRVTDAQLRNAELLEQLSKRATQLGIEEGELAPPHRARDLRELEYVLSIVANQYEIFAQRGA